MEVAFFVAFVYDLLSTKNTVYQMVCLLDNKCYLVLSANA